MGNNILLENRKMRRNQLWKYLRKNMPAKEFKVFNLGIAWLVQGTEKKIRSKVENTFKRHR